MDVVASPVPAAAAAPSPAAAPASGTPLIAQGPVPLEPEQKDANVATVRFKFPDSTHVTRKFRKSDTVSGIFAFVASTKAAEGKYFDLVVATATPPLVLSTIPQSTLESAGFASQQVVNVRF